MGKMGRKTVITEYKIPFLEEFCNPLIFNAVTKFFS